MTKTKEAGTLHGPRTPEQVLKELEALHEAGRYPPPDLLRDAVAVMREQTGALKGAVRVFEGGYPWYVHKSKWTQKEARETARRWCERALTVVPQ